ncbi:MAG: hypothetical protein KIT45_13195 [Fimbriimonadia bacterium]|nr:hypothetical protein [Fimbriimonadia bacterium]
MLKQESSPEQGQPTRESFNSHEAGEILQIAAKLGSDNYSIEQLEAIAEEAGVSREAIHQAIEARKKQQQLEEAQRLERMSRRKRFGTALMVGMVIFGLFIFVALFTFVSPRRTASNMRVIIDHADSSAVMRSLPPPASLPPMPALDEEAIRSSLSNHHVVKGKTIEAHSQSNFPLNPDQFTLAVKDLKTGEMKVIRNNWLSVENVTLSPDEKRIAFFAKDTDGMTHLWVVNSDSSTLCSVIAEKGGQLLLDAKATLTAKDIVWADENTLVVNTDQGRMQVPLDKNNIPMASQPYKPRI